MADALLTFENVRAGYGEAVVLDDISFEIPERGSLAVLWAATVLENRHCCSR